MLDALRKGAQIASIDPQGSSKKQLQLQMLQEMMAIDQERASSSVVTNAIWVLMKKYFIYVAKAKMLCRT